jgi:hypothetical protein
MLSYVLEYKCIVKKRLYSSVGIGTGWTARGSIRDRGKRSFSAPQRPDWLWGQPSLLSNGYRGLSPRGVKLTTHLHLVPKSRMVELYLHSPICLHGIVVN